MTIIKLYNIRDECSGFEFEPHTGRYRLIKWPEVTDKKGVCGFGDIRVIGLHHQEELFAAIYAHEDALHVALPPQHFVWPGSFRARRRSWLSRLKSFAIGTAGRLRKLLLHIY